jgi:hypothetical protein
MSVLTPELREALARVGTSTFIGVLNRHGPRSMCRYDVWPRRPADAWSASLHNALHSLAPGGARPLAQRPVPDRGRGGEA